MAAITTRITAGTGATVKNAPLTNTEVDNNFIALNTDLSNAVYLTGSQTISGAKTFSNNVNITSASGGSVLLAYNTTSSSSTAITIRPKQSFTSFDGTKTISATMLNSGSLSFDGSVGQLFNITDSMSGTIFSVNDISGIPSIEVLDTGLVKIAQYNGNVVVGSGTDNGIHKLQVTGTQSITANSTTDALRITQIGTGNAILVEDEANPDSTPFLVNATGQAGIGATPAAWGKLTVGGLYPSGNNFSIGNYTIGTVPSAATQEGAGFWSELSTQAATFTTTVSHFVASQGTFGAGSTVANQHGFRVSSNLIGGTNNFGFHSNIPSGTGRWNFYAQGTARNLFTGNTGIGADSGNEIKLLVGGSATGATSELGIRVSETIQSDVTSSYIGVDSLMSTQAASFTLGGYSAYRAGIGTRGAGSNITTIQGYVALANLAVGTNNYAFRGSFASAANTFNLFMDGTADNYLGGPLKIGQTYYSNTALGIFWAPAAASAIGIYQDSTINSATTTSYVLNSTFPGTAAASFTLPTLTHYQAGQNTFGAGSTVTNQFGFRVLSSLTGATNNYGFYSDIASGSGRWNFYANGTAPNLFAGSVSIGSGGSSEMLFVNQTAEATTARFVNSSSSGIYRPISVHSTANNIPGLSLSRWYSGFAGSADVGQIRFDGLGTGASYVEHASIYAIATGANTATGAPTSLSFRTSNGTSSTERMNISATGVVAVTSNITSTSTTTGSLVVTGGVGISGALNATTKSFIIGHPTKPGKLLKHGSLEGPEFGVYVRGRISGVNKIELPEYWTGLVDPATITVNLTPVGSHQNLYVYSIENNVVTVKNSNMLNKVIDCFYTVFAERCDVEKLQVEV
jgi:hypothetical protein